VGDVESMAENAIYILGDNDRLTHFKKAAIAQARKFEKQHIIPQYEKLYCRVITDYNTEKN
jgi:hypothetical protein